MKIDSTTLEKIFLPVLSSICLAGVSAIFNFHTDLKVLETKVSVNNERIQKLFIRINELREGQKEILKLLLEWEHNKNGSRRLRPPSPGTENSLPMGWQLPRGRNGLFRVRQRVPSRSRLFRQERPSKLPTL